MSSARTQIGEIMIDHAFAVLVKVSGGPKMDRA
jgi:hypothetical protein